MLCNFHTVMHNRPAFGLGERGFWLHVWCQPMEPFVLKAIPMIAKTITGINLLLYRPSRYCQPVRKRLMCPTRRAMNSFSANSKKAWRIPHMRRQPVTKWPRLVCQNSTACARICCGIVKYWVWEMLHEKIIWETKSASSSFITVVSFKVIHQFPP